MHSQSQSQKKFGRVLFCTGIFYPEIGGPATYVLKMTNEMEKRGMPYKIITYSSERKPQISDKVIKIKRSLLLLHSWRYFWSVMRNGKNCGVIYVQGSFSEGIPTVLANLFLKKRLVIRIGGIFSWEMAFGKKWTNVLVEEFLSKKQCLKSEILKSIDRWVISRCDLTVANSIYTKKLLTLNKIDAKKITVIYNAFDPIEIKKIDPDEYKKELGLDGKKIILSLGRLVAWKNIDKLVRFVQKLPDKYHLLIVGDGPEKDTIEHLIKVDGLDDRISVLGRKNRKEEDFGKIFQTADYFALISSFEGASHVLLEAIQFDLPVIASDIEPNRETLQGYDRCRLIDINENGFTKALEELGMSTGKTEKLVHLEKYSFDKIFETTIKTLCEY